jgi:SET domain-containing protein
VADEQPTFVFQASTDVAEGQELCISYVGERATEPAQRKEQLELLSWGYGINIENRR